MKPCMVYSANCPPMFSVEQSFSVSAIPMMDVGRAIMAAERLFRKLTKLLGQKRTTILEVNTHLLCPLLAGLAEWALSFYCCASHRPNSLWGQAMNSELIITSLYPSI